MIGKAVCLEDSKDLAYMSVSIEGMQHDTLCSYTIKQVFENTTGKDANIEYVFPNEQQFCTYDTLFIIDGKEIKPKLREKEEAEKEFEEAVEQGYHAMLGEEIGNGLNSFKLGNIPKDKTAEVHLKISFLANMNERGIYYKFPLTTIYQKGSVTQPYSHKPGFFSFSLSLHSTHELEKLTVSAKGETKLISPHNAEFKTEIVPKMDCIIVKAPIKSVQKSVAIASDGYIAISSYPTFEGKVESNSEFYFIVDCSGSMDGPRISIARNCLKIFIQSLPLGCRFSIITFGSQYKQILKICDYTDENLKNAMSLIPEISADMGGTNILEPIKFVSEHEPKQGYVKQIFLLTDGEVRNPDEIIAVAHENRSSNRIFTIGLGDGADPGLVKGLANKTGGNYVLILNEDSLTENIISMLSSAIAPSAANITINAPFTEMWPSPCPPIYANNPVTFIVKSSYTDNILISGNCADESVDIVVPVSQCADNLGLKELYAKYAIEDIEMEIILDDKNKSLKKKCVELSLASNTLCKYTAYIGIDFESHEEIQERYMIINGRKIRVTGLSKSKAGKHGHAKTMITGIDESTGEKIEMFVPKPSITSQEDSLPLQSVDGSWSDFEDIDPDIENKYEKKIAATIAAIVFIKKHFEDRIGEYALILKKAFAFLKRQDSEEDWESIVNMFLDKYY